jgi:hypothetical protein
MRKLLNKPWFVAALAVTAVGLCAYESLGSPKAAKRPARIDPGVVSGGAALPEPDATAPTASSLAAIEALEVASSRDPFAPRPVPNAPAAAETATGSLETLRLGAVWLQGGEALAAINSRIFRSGETIGAATVESVTREGAWLVLPSGRKFLPVGAELTHKVPARGQPPVLLATREL